MALGLLDSGLKSQHHVSNSRRYENICDAEHIFLLKRNQMSWDNSMDTSPCLMPMTSRLEKSRPQAWCTPVALFESLTKEYVLFGLPHTTDV